MRIVIWFCANWNVHSLQLAWYAEGSEVPPTKVGPPKTSGPPHIEVAEVPPLKPCCYVSEDEVPSCENHLFLQWKSSFSLGQLCFSFLGCVYMDHSHIDLKFWDSNRNAFPHHFPLNSIRYLCSVYMGFWLTSMWVSHRFEISHRFWKSVWNRYRFEILIIYSLCYL